MNKNCYKIMGLPSNATIDEIKGAYRSLAKKYHPDKNPQNNNEFYEIKEAYETLKDPKRREKHDFTFIQPKNNTPKKKTTPLKGSDLKITLNLTRTTLIQNWTKHIVIRRKGKCPVCKGTGSILKKVKKCIYCNGTGLQGFFLIFGTKKKCSYCHGSGKSSEGDLCPTCNGTTIVPEIIHHDVILSPHLRTITIPHLGNYSPHGQAGNLIVDLNIIEDPRFKIKEINVLANIMISPTQAVIGDVIPLEVFDKKFNLVIPPGTKNLQEIEIKYQGLSYKENTGNFLATIYIYIPSILSEREKELYQEILKIEKERNVSWPRILKH